MKRLSSIAVSVALLFSTSSWAAETVGGATYTYIGPNDYQFGDCADNAVALLSGVSFSRAGYVSSEELGTPAALLIIEEGSYGGVLIWVGHGGPGWVALESYEYTTEGQTQAENRIATLQGTFFAEGELALKSTTAGTQQSWNVALTSTGIAAHFGGNNAIAVVCACNSSSTGAAWHGRVALGYSGTVSQNTVTADLNTLFGNLTAHGRTDFSSMLVSQAIGNTSFATPTGNSATALFPWVTAITPDPYYFWWTPPTQVTATFGTDMDQIDDPFTVGGLGVAMKNTNVWTNATTATVNCYYGWEVGDVIVGLIPGRIKSTHGVPLNNGQDYVVEYFSAADEYPYAASVNAFVPSLGPDGVSIFVDLMTVRGTAALWIDRDGTIVGDTIRVERLEGHAFTVADPYGTQHSRYLLYEREYGGRVFLRASEGVTEPVSVVLSEPDVEEAALRLAAYTVVSSDLPVEPPVCIAICPDSFVTTTQQWANYRSARGTATEVVPLSVSGQTKETIQGYIALRYGEGVRYVVLFGSASDHEWFDDPDRWPDLPGNNDWRFWYDDYHSPGGYSDLVSQPERDLIPTWYVADVEFDNMSYWTPYYASDFPYRVGLPGLRVARVPAYSRAGLLAWLAKDLAYCYNAATEPWAHDVGIWAQCHNWDGNSGPSVRALVAELSDQMPPIIDQYALIDTTWDQTQRQTFAVAAWNQGRGIIYCQGTSSTPYKPIHFFSKSGGWHVGLLAEDRYPVLVGACCGIATHDMAVSPVYGDFFATEVLTGSATRGTPFLIGPSRGSWAEGNRRMAQALNTHLSVSPATDLGTAFMLAQDEVLAGGQSSAIQTALSYSLLGDPLAPLPEDGIVTAVDTRMQSGLSLGHTYPNPFNPSTTIEYTLSGRQHVTLSVFNVAGQLVEELVDETQRPGPHRVVWHARGFPSGVYFCRLEAGGSVRTLKVVLVK